MVRSMRQTLHTTDPGSATDHTADPSERAQFRLQIGLEEEEKRVDISPIQTEDRLGMRESDPPPHSRGALCYS